MQPLEQINRSNPARSSARRADRLIAWLRTPRGLMIAGLIIIVAGLGLGWNWLSALGLAPVILSVAPCAVMCALGLCMMGGGRKAPANAVQPSNIGMSSNSAGSSAEDASS